MARATPASDPPQSVVTVLELAVDAVLGGSHGYFHVPRDGYLNVTWLTRRKCYRVTVDLTAGHPLDGLLAPATAAVRQ